MRRTLLALVALSRSVHLLAQLHTAPTMMHINTDKKNVKIANKSLEFVNIIREDLRRDNDDYELERQKLKLASQPKHATKGAQHHRPPPTPPGPRLPNRNRIMPPIRPPAQHMQTKHPPPKHRATFRAQLGPLARHPPLNAPVPVRAPSFRAPLPAQPSKMSINMWNGLDMTQKTTSKVAVVPNDVYFRSYTHSKNYKKDRIDKLKQLVEKEKKKIREAARHETKATLAAMPHAPLAANAIPTLPPLRPKHYWQHNNSMTEARGPPPLTPKPKEYSSQQRLAALSHLDEDQSPSPEQLDMAPARGAKITLNRFKGRLCQRSLMNIEGPSYDKLGNIVIPSHDPKRYRHEFHQTRIPSYILPRCCNCCKKSVLGCQ